MDASRIAGIIALITASFTTGATHAGLLPHTELTPAAQQKSITIDDVQVSIATSTRVFALKDSDGVQGTGIAGGVVDGEIDHDEYIEITFDAPVRITSLTVAHLYAAGNHGDMFNEQARFVTDAGSFDLTATFPTVGKWGGVGTVANLSPAIDGHGGMWNVSGTNIFREVVTSIRMMAGYAGDHHSFSDFSFVSLQFTAIPAPGAFALMAVAAVMAVRRRR